MRSKFAGALVIAGAAVALGVAGVHQMKATPALHDTAQASCTPEAVKRIADITERAIQASKCAQAVR